jgi:hypothetical protein
VLSGETNLVPMLWNRPLACALERLRCRQYPSLPLWYVRIVPDARLKLPVIMIAAGPMVIRWASKH